MVNVNIILTLDEAKRACQLIEFSDMIFSEDDAVMAIGIVNKINQAILDAQEDRR